MTLLRVANGQYSLKILEAGATDIIEDEKQISSQISESTLRLLGLNQTSNF